MLEQCVEESRAKTALARAFLVSNTEAESVGKFQSRITIQCFLIVCPTDKDSNDSAVPSGFEDSDELQNHGKALSILV